MRTHYRMVSTLAALACLAGMVSHAHAARWELGGHLVYAEPRGDFDLAARRGIGLQAHGILGLDPAGILGIRVDAGILNYGSETVSVPLIPTRRVSVDVTTTNNVAALSIGPHVAVRSGPLQPYLYATTGLGYFFTESHLDGDGDESFARTLNFDDVAPAYAFGGGLRTAIVPFLDFDVGVEVRRHRRVSYLGQGDIVEEPDGSVTLRVHESEADLVLFRVGVSFSPR